MDNFIQTKCKENYYISPTICFPFPAGANVPAPTLIFEQGKTYQYRLELYDHPHPQFRTIWHTVYKIPEEGEKLAHGTNFSLANFSRYFECIEA